MVLFVEDGDTRRSCVGWIADRLCCTGGRLFFASSGESHIVPGIDATDGAIFRHAATRLVREVVSFFVFRRGVDNWGAIDGVPANPPGDSTTIGALSPRACSGSEDCVHIDCTELIPQSKDAVSVGAGFDTALDASSALPELMLITSADGLINELTFITLGRE